MRVSDAIFARLEKETSCVYFVAGGNAMFLVDALGRSRLQPVAALHEQGAGFMAIGHAMATGKLGVCLSTSGPGAANMLTACLAAWTDSIPVLFISGQARTEMLTEDALRTHGLQPADIIQTVKPMIKASFEPKNAKQTMIHLDRIIDACLCGRRGPGWLSVPLDVQAVEV